MKKSFKLVSIFGLIVMLGFSLSACSSSSSEDETETEKVILHEIGHAKNDDYSHRDYKYSYVTRVFCEDCADDFVIKERIRQFVALNNEPTDANYINLAHSIGTQDYGKVKSELLKYIGKNK